MGGGTGRESLSAGDQSGLMAVRARFELCSLFIMVNLGPGSRLLGSSWGPLFCLSIHLYILERLLPSLPSDIMNGLGLSYLAFFP